MKFIVIGFDDNACHTTYSQEDIEKGVGVIHAYDKGCGSGETAACSLDIVHGIQIADTKRPLTCKACLKTVKYYKTVKIGRG